MIYRVLADLVLFLHLAFIVFAVAGGLFALRWRRTPLLHLPAVAWAAFVETTSGICPLTPLENALRRAAGLSDYSGGFVEHYVVPTIYPPSLSPPTQLVFAGAVVAANILVYLLVWQRHCHARSSLRA